MRAFKLSHTWIAGVLLTSCAGGSNGDLYGSTSNLVEAESNEVYVAELELLDMEVLVENEQDLAVEVYAFDREGRTEVVLGELAAGERTTWHLPVGATEGPVYLIARPSRGNRMGGSSRFRSRSPWSQANMAAGPSWTVWSRACHRP